MLSDEYRYKILRLLEADPQMSQRDLAHALGISLGKANYCLQALIQTGLIKARNFKNNRHKAAYMYLLTHRGITEKARVAVRFLRHKMDEYEHLQREIAAVGRGVNPETPRIPYGRHYLDESDIEAVVAQMRTPWLTQGPRIAEFEAAIAKYVGAKYAVAMSSGTASLHLACLAAGVGPGARAVTSPNSFVASANCVLYCGGTPEFVDIERETLNMDPERLRERIERGPEVKAIIPVHFAGAPCNMAEIARLARRAGAAVIEDAAHALGARYKTGERVGGCACSDMTVFSFHPVKNIACGEGGMVTTNREDLYRRLLRLRSHGINKLDDPYEHLQNAYTDGRFNRWYYEMQELGYNCRMTDLQAALGLSQFQKLDLFLARRAELAQRYRQLFRGGKKGIRPAQSGVWGDSANHLFVIRATFGAGESSRTAYMQRLFDGGYATQVHYIPIPMHPYYARHGYDTEGLPETASYYREGLSIPLYFGLSDQQQDDFVRAALEER